MDKERKGMIIPSGTYAEVADYKEQIIKDYQGNPFIEALPPILSKTDVYYKLATYPKYSEEERGLDGFYRYHCIQRLFNFFQPLNVHSDLEQRLSWVIRQGYISRNPILPGYATWLQRNYEYILNGGYTWDINQQNEGSVSSLSIIGVSGIGKTSAIKRVLSIYPQVIIHSKYKNINLSGYQLVWLKLDCPHDGSLKSLCINFFYEVDRLLGTEYYKRSVGSKDTAQTLLPKISQVAYEIGLGVLIVDEIQHLNLAISGGSDKALNFFVNLVNVIGLPVVMIGTTKALPILQGEFRQAKRSCGQGCFMWDRMKNNDEWDLFVEAMWEFQWTKKHAELTTKLKNTLYEESQGIIDMAIKLFAMAQIRAIALDKEEVSSSLIKTIAGDTFQLVKPMLDALKSGDLSRIEAYKDITPIDIEEFKQVNLSEISAKEQAKQISEIQNDNKINKKKNSEVVNGITLGLLELEVAPTTAKKAAEKVLEKHGSDIDLSVGIKEAYKLALLPSNSKVEIMPEDKSKNKKKPEPFDEKDLRKVVNSNEEGHGYSTLKSNNYIKDPNGEL